MGEMLERSVWRKPSSRLSISAFSFAPSFCIEEVAKHGNPHTHLLGLKVAGATSHFLRNKKLQEAPPAEKAQPECTRERTHARTLNGRPCEAQGQIILPHASRRLVAVMKHYVNQEVAWWLANGWPKG